MECLKRGGGTKHAMSLYLAIRNKTGAHEPHLSPEQQFLIAFILLHMLFILNFEPLLEPQYWLVVYGCLSQFRIYTTWGSLHSNLKNYSIAVLLKKLFKHFPYILIC